MARLTIHMDDDLKQCLRIQAARNGLSMAEEVRQMLREALLIEQPKAKTCRILTDTAVSLADFRKDPIGTLHECGSETVVILDQDQPVFYAVTPTRYEAILELIGDTRLTTGKED